MSRRTRTAGAEPSVADMFAEATKERMSAFSERLLAWYRIHKRDLPWRRTRDPYAIWVSEVMLQQTRVDTVIPYWRRFMERFPTAKALAEAPEGEVLKLWEGLGYYSRARNLQAAARELCDRFDGRVPADREAFASLKGVGPYTTGAVLSIAYDMPEPAVDGNVMRVLSRHFRIHEDIAKPAARVRMEKLAKALIPEGAAGDFNQALMELGATVCTPKSPYCLVCPVMEHCAGRLAGEEESLPIKTKAKAPRPEHRSVAWIEGEGDLAGRILIRQRPDSGLLARMWELPHVLWDDGPEADGGAAEAGRMADLAAKLADEEKVTVRPYALAIKAEHVFSHLHWHLNVYRCAYEPPSGRKAQPQAGTGFGVPGLLLAADPSGAYAAQAETAAAGESGRLRWVSLAELDRYAFPNVFLKIIRELRGQ